MAELQGGKFGHGFLSAGIAKGLTPLFSGIGDGAFDVGGINIGEVFVAGIVGGTVSELAGGKFANGAYTAAMGNLFNKQGFLDKLKEDFKSYFKAKSKKTGDVIEVVDTLTRNSGFKNPEIHDHAHQNACSNNAAFQACYERAGEWIETLHVDGIAKSHIGQGAELIIGGVGKTAVCEIYCQKPVKDPNGKWIFAPELESYIPPVPEYLKTFSDPTGAIWDHIQENQK